MGLLFLVGLASAPRFDQLVPVFLVTAALAALAGWVAWHRRQHRRAARLRLAELLALSPEAFEAWVADCFRERGYAVRRTGATGDHGIDVLATRRGETIVIQCKRYRDRTVGEPTLRDLFGAMHASQATRACLVTTGTFTPAARAWAKDKPIELWDQATVMHLALTTPATTAPAAAVA